MTDSTISIERELSLNKLMQRITQRDIPALSLLYDLEAPRTYAIILHLLREGTDAEDTLHDVFLRVWNEARSWPTDTSPSESIMHIARSHATAHLRSREAKTLSGEETARQKIAEAMLQLQPEVRTLIDYACFDGYTVSKLAEHFALPPGIVKARIRSGMFALRVGLRDHHPEQQSVMNSAYLEELAALHALGALDGIDADEFKRLAPNVDEETKRHITSFEEVASLIPSGLVRHTAPPTHIKEKILWTIHCAFAADAGGTG